MTAFKSQAAVLLARLLFPSSAAMIHEPLHTHYARLGELDSSGVAGQVGVFATTSGDLLVAGSASGLEPSLLSYAATGYNCSSKNGCGAHVHSGYSCDNGTSQGGHLFASSLVDPWTNISYMKTDANGHASFSFSLSIGIADIAAKPFVLHDSAGKRVACGMLMPMTENAVQHAEILPVNGDDFAGVATLFATDSVLAAAGFVSGLEPSLLASTNGGVDCTAKNGCGVHVHSGSACTNSSVQGGHYYVGNIDPWAPIGYTQTNSAGNASFVFMLDNFDLDVSSKPFVVHNNAGGRVGCGMLMESLANPSTSAGSSDSVTTSGNFMATERATTSPVIMDGERILTTPERATTSPVIMDGAHELSNAIQMWPKFLTILIGYGVIICSV